MLEPGEGLENEPEQFQKLGRESLHSFFMFSTFQRANNYYLWNSSGPREHPVFSVF